MKMKEYVFTTTGPNITAKVVLTIEVPGEQQPAKDDGPFDEDKFLEGELAAFLQNYDKEYDDDAVVSDVAIHFYELGKKMMMNQKPAEWSEGDENIRQSLINDLENAETEDEDVQKELNEKVAWLKSLRP